MSGTDFYYPAQVDLAEKLVEIVPGGKNKKVFFCNSGAEAVEASMKLARYATGRKRFVAFYGAFHGRTFGALSLTASKAVQRKGFGPLLSGVVHAPYGYCYRCPYNLEYPGCNFACVHYIEDVIFKKHSPPEEIAALILEPIQGEGGYIIPPPGYFEKLKEIIEPHGILMVDDEVQAGMGRTGKMFAIEHWDVIPEIVALAKGIASGMPLGASVAKSSLCTWGSGAHASTFGGNPVCCAAALATVDLLENGLIDNAEKTGGYILEELSRAQERHEFIGDVRGKGMMIGLEFVKDKKTKEPAPELRDRIVMDCFHKGLLVLGAGSTGMRFSPPLVITRDEASAALDIFFDVLKSI
jgi:4-aminobutyrate aminotransferase